ncbi:MAG: aldehyde dehydrogenase family protein, partial [Verrucomicrobiaceae bacterium]
MLQQLTGSLIGEGIRSAATTTRELVNPATEQSFHALTDAAPDDVDRAAQVAHQSWEHSWRSLNPGGRAALLHKLANLIEANADQLSELDSRSMGKPLAAARGEVLAGAQTFRYYAGALSFPKGDVIPVARGGFDFTLRQPLGVVACIVPWNFP